MILQKGTFCARKVGGPHFSVLKQSDKAISEKK